MSRTPDTERSRQTMIGGRSSGRLEPREDPRLGRYEVFVPDPLPPAVAMDEELVLLVAQATDAIARLDGVTQVLPNPDLFVAMYMKKEALLSSQIEGTQASLRGVLEFEADLRPSENINEVREVINYLKAMGHGLEAITFRPFSLELLNQIHRFLIAGTRGASLRPGQVRDVQNWVGTAGTTIREARFVPPPPELVVPLLEDLIAFIGESDHMPPLVKAAVVHAQFETIHPYLDGNGRMGRLLITFLLCQRSVLDQPVLYLSHYLRRHQQEYYRLLNEVRFAGAWEAWLRFFLAGVCAVSNDAIETAKRIIALRSTLTNRLVEHRIGGVHAVRLVDYAFAHPILTSSRVAEALGVSRQTAHTLVQRFEAAGILAEITGQQRHRQYQFTEYLAIIEEGTHL